MIPACGLYKHMTASNLDPREFDNLCYEQSRRIKQLPLNDQYTQTIEYRGQVYHYDPDYDCFYPRVEWSKLSYWDRYGWIWVAVVLTAIAGLAAV